MINVSENVYIYSVGMTKFGKFLDKGMKQMTKEVLEATKNDSNLDFKDIEAAWFSNCTWGLYENQHGIRGQVALSANRIDKIPIINVENACASGSTALHGAWATIKAGLYDCALAIGVEKIYNEDRKKMMQGFITYTDVEKTTAMVAQLKKMAEKKRQRTQKSRDLKYRKKKREDILLSWIFMQWQPALT